MVGILSSLKCILRFSYTRLSKNQVYMNVENIYTMLVFWEYNLFAFGIHICKTSFAKKMKFSGHFSLLDLYRYLTSGVLRKTSLKNFLKEGRLYNTCFLWLWRDLLLWYKVEFLKLFKTLKRKEARTSLHLNFRAQRKALINV